MTLAFGIWNRRFGRFFVARSAGAVAAIGRCDTAELPNVRHVGT